MSRVWLITGSFPGYGALSPEPTPLPLFDVLVKDLTIRGYRLVELTNDPARLKRGKRFINEGLADESLKQSSPGRSRSKRSSRPTATWSRTSRREHEMKDLTRREFLEKSLRQGARLALPLPRSAVKSQQEENRRPTQRWI